MWTQVAEDNTTACDDIILDRKLTEEDFMRYMKSFENDLAAFVRRGSNPQLRLEYDLFPNIKRVWYKDGSTSYTVCGVDLSACTTLSRLPSGGQYDVDLLTHRFKWRTYWL